MGIVLSFIVAITEAIKSIFVKKGALKFSTVMTAWSWQTTSLIIMIPVLLVIGVPELNSTFWISSSVKIVLNAGALFLYTKSLKESDISLAIPMLALTPLVTVIVSYFLNGELPTLLGNVGILVIIVGTYLLNFKKGTKNLLAPFKEVFDNKGVFYMLLVAIIWGVTTSLDKTAVINSSPLFYAAYVAIVTSILFTPLVIIEHRRELRRVFNIESLKALLPIGLLDGIVILCQMAAVSLIVTAYVISIKRASIIFSTFLAYIFFKEKIRERMVPILVMFMGLLMIVFS